MIPINLSLVLFLITFADIGQDIHFLHQPIPAMLLLVFEASLGIEKQIGLLPEHALFVTSADIAIVHLDNLAHTSNH